MKKIGIITLNGYFNYGNRLQNYALEMTLKKQGNKVKTIRLDRRTNIQTLKNKLSHLKRKLMDGESYENDKNREDIFKEFSNVYLEETESIFNINQDLSSLDSYYDNFIVGSDQVWNPSMNRGSSVYFLQFAQKHKRLSYSPSFGVSKFSEEITKKYSKWISDMPNVSVREDDGARIVKKLTGKEAQVLLDPTMLLSREEWIKISNAGKSKPKGKYLLTYFLGSTPKDYQAQVQSIAKEHNLEIINIGDPEEPIFYETGPSEFIDYINDAEIFCTDSFHGVVFSILLQKPFIVYERKGSESMYSRIRTIIDMFGFHSREYRNIQTIDRIFDIDYSSSIDVIEREKERSITFLNGALDYTN